MTSTPRQRSTPQHRVSRLVVEGFSPLCRLTGHEDGVSSVAWGPDGLLASASHDKSVKIWRDGLCLRTLRGHENFVSCVAFSPLGLLASCSWDKTVKVWDAQAGTLLWTLRGHSKDVCGLAFSPAGILASCSKDKSIIVWDIKTGSTKFTLRGHDGKAPCICGELYSFDKARPDCPVTGHEGTVWCVAIFNNVLASGSEDETVRLWDLNTGEPLRSLTGHSDGVLCVAISACKIAASGSRDKTVRLWDITTGNPVGSPLTGHFGTVYCIAISGSIVASGSSDKTVRLWDITNANPVGSPLRGHDGEAPCICVGVRGLHFKPDPKCQVTGHSAEVLSVAFPSMWSTLAVQQEINISSKHKDKYQSRFFGLPSNCVRRVLDFLGTPLASAASEDRAIMIWNISAIEYHS